MSDEQLAYVARNACGKSHCSDYTAPAHRHAVAVFPATVEVLHHVAAVVCCN